VGPAEVVWPPHPYRAGFCITDDTDAATLESVGLVYDFLASIGLRTTKTVWAFAPAEPCGIPPLPESIQKGITLEDPAYLAYVAKLSERGFEICLHGASAGNNVRERTLRALDLLDRQIGHSATYVCHAKNAENPYWHEKVAPAGPARALLSLASRYRCSGEDPSSPYYWGDACRERIRQIRLFRTRRINTLAANPSMPYFDPEKPRVAGWFAATKRSFRDCTTKEALEGLKREYGLCVLYQYLHRYAVLAERRVQSEFVAGAERLMGDGEVLVDSTGALMDRLRLIQGIVPIARENELWLLNTNSRDVAELQLRVPESVALRAAASGVERRGERVRIPRLAAGSLLFCELDRAVSFRGANLVTVDRRGVGTTRLGFGRLWVNVGSEPWTSPAGETLAPGTHRLRFDDAVKDLEPRVRAGPAERYALLAEQLTIIGREILWKGRSPSTRKFLGAPRIPLEDHANW
jgi:hypothetical protein